MDRFTGSPFIRAGVFWAQHYSAVTQIHCVPKHSPGPSSVSPPRFLGSRENQWEHSAHAAYSAVTENCLNHPGSCPVPGWVSGGWVSQTCTCSRRCFLGTSWLLEMWNSRKDRANVQWSMWPHHCLGLEWGGLTGKEGAFWGDDYIRSSSSYYKLKMYDSYRMQRTL